MKVKGYIKREGIKKVTKIGHGPRSRDISKNASAGCRAKKYRGQGR